MPVISQDLIEAGRLATQIHQEISGLIAPGVNLLTIEKRITERIAIAGMKAAFKGYKNYPSASCLSVNSAVVHAIPYDYSLKPGDVLSVDLGINNNGWIVDTAQTHPIGQVSPRINQLLEVTKRALTEGIKAAKAGNHTGDIGQIVQKIVESAGFYIIRDLTGHGVGKKLQMPPSIPNFGRAGTGALMKEGMILAIEPITALQKVSLVIEKDGWTIRTHPDVVSAHFEHTIVVTNNGPVILTQHLPTYNS